MGIAALRKVLPPAPFDVARLKGRTVAVDADNLVWSFVTAMAGTGELPKAPDGRSNAHLLGLLNRLGLYAKWGAQSVWVFDGVQPDLKEATLIARGERIEAARVVGDNYQASVAVDEDDLQECRTLLKALGLPWVDSPGEADAQCAQLVQVGHAWAAVTQDWDIALFGAPRALRNLTLSQTRTPEVLDLADALKAAGLTREQLVDAAILMGTDYNEGVAGVGPVKALKLVKKGGEGLAPALASVGTPAHVDRIRALYFEHPVDNDVVPKVRKPDAKAVAKLLGDRGIPETRGEDLLAAFEG